MKEQNDKLSLLGGKPAVTKEKDKEIGSFSSAFNKDDL